MGSQNGRFSEMPPVTDLAERVSLGATSVQLAELYGVGDDYLRGRLLRAGFNPDTGEAKREEHTPYATTVGDANLLWQDQGACVGKDSEQFFDELRPKEAINICTGCPIRERCLSWAMEVEGKAARDYRYGIFGGLTSAQRFERAMGATA
jgi:hypothetical protein